MIIGFLPNIGIMEMITLLFMSYPLSILGIIPFWHIFKKAGFSPWWSLATVVPIVNIIVLCYLAFSPWKSQQDKEM